MLLVVAAVLVVLGCAEGQFVNGRWLEGPDPESCAKRVIHEKLNGVGYFYSWKYPPTAKTEEDWLGARNFCRKMCMDSVSTQTKEENEFIKSRIVRDKVKYIWTSGRLCTFKGCDRKDLQPVNINGWFWSSDGIKLPPTTDRQLNDWSPSGGLMRPQPDNREELQNGAREECLAILNYFYGDGVHWHDVACHHRKPFVCEESKSLLDYVRYKNPQLNI